ARACVMDDIPASREPHQLDGAAVAAETKRLEAACAAATEELDTIISRVSAQVGEEEAAIFRAHRQLLRDPVLINKVKSIILNLRVDARTALQESLEQYSTLFAQIHDDYLKERMADVRDVIGRIAGHLTRQETEQRLACEGPVIVVASEILPSQA